MASLAKQQRCKPPEPPPTHPACFFLSSLSSCLMDTPLGCCPDAVLHGSANCELQHHGAGERVGGGRFTGRRRRRQGVIRHAVRAHLTSLSATTALARGKRQETTAAAEEKTAGGIIIPDTAKEKPQRGIIVAAGTGKKDEPMTVKVGDNVLYGKYAGTEITIEGQDLLIMRESDILAIV